MEEEKEKFELKNPDIEEEPLSVEPPVEQPLLTGVLEGLSNDYKEKNARLRPIKLFLGLATIIIGCLFLAQNLGWLKINVYLDWAKIWPVMIIFIGLSMINFRGWLGALINFLVFSGLLAMVLWIVL